MIRSILSLFVLLLLSFSLFTQVRDSSHIDEQASFGQLKLNINPLSIVATEECPDCSGDSCRTSENCCINICSCTSPFSPTNSKIVFTKKGSKLVKTLWHFARFYKSHSIGPELQPPQLS